MTKAYLKADYVDATCFIQNGTHGIVSFIHDDSIEFYPDTSLLLTGTDISHIYVTLDMLHLEDSYEY